MFVNKAHTNNVDFSTRATFVRYNNNEVYKEHCLTYFATF